MKVAIISSSVRHDRKSHRVALFFRNYLVEHSLAEVEILDLNDYQFPVFSERLRLTDEPNGEMLEFAEDVLLADGIIIVTPEYNGGMPASLKNAIDLLYREWKRKPIAIAGVSSGNFGATQVVTSLVFILWKIGACLVPAMFQVPKVNEAYDEHGNPSNKEQAEKLAKPFIDELLWWMEAKQLRQATDN